MTEIKINVTLNGDIEFEKITDALRKEIERVGYKIEVAKPEYRKVTERMPKAGDFVKISEICNDDFGAVITFGKYYEIIGIDCSDPLIIGDDGDKYDTCGDTFEIYEKTAPCGVRPEPLKVGDYAIVVGVENTRRARGAHGFEIGEVVKLDKPFLLGDGFRCSKLDEIDTDSWNVERADLVRATDEEIAEAKLKQLEKAEAEKKESERKELERRWAKIGRKPNEFKKGDIVRVTWTNGHKVGDIGEIAHADGTDRPSVLVGGMHQYDRVELITPVEARFDKSEGDR